MKVTIRTVNEGEYVIAEMDTNTVQPMVDNLCDKDSNVLALQMDEAVIYLVKRNIVAIEVD